MGVTLLSFIGYITVDVNSVKMVRSRSHFTRSAWPLTVANCVSVHITSYYLMNGPLSAVKR